jgi:hypothetical protein
LIVAFQDEKDEEYWVQKAERQLNQMKDLPPDDRLRESVYQALRRAKELADKGQRQEAEERWQAIEDLYRSDPSARDILDQIHRDRQAKPN